MPESAAAQLLEEGRLVLEAHRPITAVIEVAKLVPGAVVACGQRAGPAHHAAVLRADLKRTVEHHRDLGAAIHAFRARAADTGLAHAVARRKRRVAAERMVTARPHRQPRRVPTRSF